MLYISKKLEVVNGVKPSELGFYPVPKFLESTLRNLYPFVSLSFNESDELVGVEDDSEKRAEYTPSEDNPKPKTVEELAAENKMLKAQLQAQSDRADFIEDCIAEMAVQVYGGV